MAPLRWLDWNEATFASARAQRKPILLSIVAAWAAACRRMDAEVFTDPTVGGLVAAAFVPVRVDADERPDIAERYGLGGWPTTAFLTADGALLGGGTFLDAAALSRSLDGVAGAHRDRFDELTRRGRDLLAVDRRDDAGPVPPEDDPAVMASSVLAAFDPRHGGLATSPKFVHAAPVELALDHTERTGDDRGRALGVLTLDAMASGALHDAARGGFYRAARGADWSDPEPAKLLDVNADALMLYADAWRRLRLDRHRDVAEGILRFVRATLADGDGGFYRGQIADPGAPDSAGDVDRRVFVAANARMARALLHAGEVFDAADVATLGVAALERLLPAVYERGAGIARRVSTDGEVASGLLEDQVALSAAALDAHEATGQAVYADLAEELMRWALRWLWDARLGGFADRAPAPDGRADIGLLAHRVKPFGANCEAAQVLARLASRAGADDLAGRARDTLASQRPVSRQSPVALAHYALALQHVAGARARGR